MIKKSQEDSEEKLADEDVQCSLKDTFTVIKLDSPLPDDLFSFTPPPEAKETPNENVRRHRRIWKKMSAKVLELRQAGKYDEAVVIAKQALSVAVKKLGYPYGTTSMDTLALLYDKQGKHEEAESLYKRVLTIREKRVGPDHADVATSLDNLAALYRETGREEEAEALEKRAATIRAKIDESRHDGNPFK